MTDIIFGEDGLRPISDTSQLFHPDYRNTPEGVLFFSYLQGLLQPEIDLARLHPEYYKGSVTLVLHTENLPYTGEAEKLLTEQRLKIVYKRLPPDIIPGKSDLRFEYLNTQNAGTSDISVMAKWPDFREGKCKILDMRVVRKGLGLNILFPQRLILAQPQDRELVDELSDALRGEETSPEEKIKYWTSVEGTFARLQDALVTRPGILAKWYPLDSMMVVPDRMMTQQEMDQWNEFVNSLNGKRMSFSYPGVTSDKPESIFSTRLNWTQPELIETLSDGTQITYLPAEFDLGNGIRGFRLLRLLEDKHGLFVSDVHANHILCKRNLMQPLP